MSLTSKVEKHLLGCLPPGVPPSWLTIIDACLLKNGRSRTFAAKLIMFDGREGRVEVFRAGEALGIPIWGHRWTDLPGGSVSYENGAWIRIDPRTLEPFPDQASLPFAEAG